MVEPDSTTTQNHPVGVFSGENPHFCAENLQNEKLSVSPNSPDLSCEEKLLSRDSLSSTSSEHSTFADSEYTLGGSRSSSPLSAVDIFTEFNQNVLQPMYDQVESNTDSFNTS